MTQSATSSTVHQLRVEEVREAAEDVRKKRPGPEIRPLPGPKPPTKSDQTLEVVIAAFTGLGYALSARGLLLLSLIGAFVLANKAIDNLSFPALAVLVSYCLLTVIPVTYLEVRKMRE